ncbi:MAG: hypothetical protein P4L31_06080 [Candidatus Babeliales bacterium]|nr:hypothetical protein [Candidatus Babeliales bacterium]
MRKLFSLFLSLLFFSQLAVAKVLIITHSYNRPDFIEMQSEMFKKFMLDDYEFVVFSDAKDEVMNQAIMDTCKKSDVRCIRMPQELHKKPYLPRQPGDLLDRPNIRHVNVVQYSMDILGFGHNGPVVVLDSDMFLVRPISIVEQMKDCDIFSLMRGAGNGVIYCCPIIMIFAMNELPNKKTMNFNCGKADGQSVDSGGYTHYYFKNNPTVRLKHIDELQAYQLFCPDNFNPSSCIDTKTLMEEQILKLVDMGFNEKEIAFLQKKPNSVCYLLRNSFIHYRAGSNYDNQSMLYEKQKMALIKEYLDDLLKN